LKHHIAQLERDRDGRGKSPVNSRDQENRAKSPGNSRDPENQFTRPLGPYAARPQTPVRQRKVVTIPNAKKMANQDSAARTPCGDLTNCDGPMVDRKNRDLRSDQKILTNTAGGRATSPRDEIVAPKHVPVIPLSPVKNGDEEAAGDLACVNESMTASQPTKYPAANTYDGYVVRSILRKKSTGSVKADRRNPECRITFREEELEEKKSPPKWYLEALYGTSDKEQESEAEEKAPQRQPKRLQSRPGTPRPRRETPVPVPVATRWRG